MGFSTEVERLMIASGWREDRYIDISEYERAVISSGNELCAPVCEFLRRYGDLEIETVIGDSGLNTLISDVIGRRPVSHLSPNLNLTLYSIGVCWCENVDLHMDISGRVYRHMQMTSQNIDGIDLYRIAASGEEALELLIMEEVFDLTLHGEWITHWR
jgi:hypothetical protein